MMRDHLLMRRLCGLLAVAILGVLVGCQTTDGTAARVEDVKPDDAAQINTKLGVAYMQRGDLETAMVKLRKAVEQDPRSPQAHYALALLYTKLDETAAAEKHFRRAVSLDPLYSDAQNAYAAFLCKEGKYDQAEKHFQAALSNPLYKARQTVMINAGECAYRAGNLQRAEEYTREVLQLNANNPRALLLMTRISYDSQRDLMARAYLQRYHDLTRPTPESLWVGIQLERRLGDKNAEASYALLLRSEFPDSDEARKLLESQ